MKKAARKVFGVFVVGAFILAVATSVAAPAQADIVCWTASNGATDCQDNGSGGTAPGTGGVGGGAGNDIALPPPPPPAPVQQAPSAPINNVPPPAAPRPAAPVPAPVKQAPSMNIPAPTQNYAPALSVQRPAAPSVREQPSRTDAVVTEATKNQGASEEVKPEVKAEDKASAEKSDSKTAPVGDAKTTNIPTPVSSPSASETSSSPSEIDASQASAAEPIMNAALAIFCLGVLSYLTWGLVIKPRLNRNTSTTDESWIE